MSVSSRRVASRPPQVDYDSKLSTSHLGNSSAAGRGAKQVLAASHPVRCFVACFKGDLTSIRR